MNKTSLVGLVGLSALFVAGSWGCDDLGGRPGEPAPVPDSFGPTDARGQGPPARAVFFPDFSGPVVTADRTPPPISGGTLLMLRDGRTAVAADPDLDKIFIADLRDTRLVMTVDLDPGAEPGRSVQDTAGRVHVVLRGRGSVLTLTEGSFARATERRICAAPRGIAFAAAADELLVACAGGELVALPSEGPVSRTMLVKQNDEVLRDLRDVALADDKSVIVSRFRSAELLLVSRQTGAVVQRNSAGGSVFANAPLKSQTNQMARAASPSVAWQMRSLPTGGVAMIHQEATNAELGTGEGSGGYGVDSGCGGPIAAAVTMFTPGMPVRTGTQMGFVVLPVDFAVSADGGRMAVVAAGNKTGGAARTFPSVSVFDMNNVNFSSCVTPNGAPGGFGGDAGVPFPPKLPGPGPQRLDAGVVGRGGVDAGAVVADAGAIESGDAGAPEEPPLETVDFKGVREPRGVPIAVAFDGLGRVVVQTRDPARLEIVTSGGASIVLSDESRADTGHAIFHAAVGTGLACASCHPEGGDDGRIWSFSKIGLRQTQNLRGGIAKTAPFHWDGDMRDMHQLMTDVFSSRMGGPPLSLPHKDALAGWLDHVPALPMSPATDATAVTRGKALFESGKVACAACHNGPRLSNNLSQDVGTGKAFQTPSLLGVGMRAPFMHDGCAKTLEDRFTQPACGGGDRHGVTSHLTSVEIHDLVSYLESL